MANPVTMRLTGLTSGFDTDAIIQNLMNSQQLKLNRQLRTQTTLKWKQEKLQEVGAELKTFTQTYMSQLSSKNIYTASAYKAYSVKTTGNDNEAVSVTAGSTAQVGRVTIRQVKQLATAATASSGDDVASGGQLNLGTALSLANFSTQLVYGDSGKISFAINGREFSFGIGASMNDVMKAVNNSDAGVTMKYSELTEKLSISSNTMGGSGAVRIVNFEGNAFGGSSRPGAFGIETGVYQNGQDAIVVFDDGSAGGLEVFKKSNSFSADGLQYTLNRTTETTDPYINIAVSRDVDSCVDKLKEFVNGYNTLVEKLEKMISERKTTKERGYTPLTEAEKADMTDKQIEEWETIAKKGLFLNDAGLSTLANGLRSALYESVKAAGISPSAVGLMTGDYWSGTGGKIQLDEDMLRSALEKDPDQVMAAFTNLSVTGDPKVDHKENGLLNRISGLIGEYTKGTQTITLASIDRSLYELDSKIYQMEQKMDEMAERYYLKFAAMETALANMQSQSDWLAGMLGTK